MNMALMSQACIWVTENLYKDYMLSNLEIIGWKKFRGQPKLDEAGHKNLVLLLIDYISLAG